MFNGPSNTAIKHNSVARAVLPSPINAYSRAEEVLKYCMDNAATAPVRIAVIQLPSISAKKSPFVASYNKISLTNAGSRFGKRETTLTPKRPQEGK